jgi:DNA-binding NtrC family response regulator
VRINCASFSESLLESELFGHDKGAFTGATEAKQGLFEAADGGTLFLDEIGDMPPSLQAKLLRVIEDRQVRRVGSVKTRKVDVRFVAATHKNLETEATKGTFRSDLFFRLNGITLTIPPLRERRAEIIPLANAFLAEAARRDGRAPPTFAGESTAMLTSYSWPGNVRELKNVVERALLLATGESITPECLQAEKMQTTVAVTGQLRADVDAFERGRIVAALEQVQGNQTKAAKLLGISRSTLVTRMDEYKLPRPRKS